MMETPTRRKTVTSSLNKISADQLHGKKVGGRRYSVFPNPYVQQASGQTFKDDVNGFSPQRIFTSWIYVTIHVMCAPPLRCQLSLK